MTGSGPDRSVGRGFGSGRRMMAIFIPLVFFALDLRPAPASEPSGWLRGYAKTISGDTLLYHSPYPEAKTALLVRATDGKMAIAWETEPAPEKPVIGQATFVWMAGIAAGKGAHRFDLEIDGSRALSFRTAPASSLRTWTVKGTDGSSLTFETAMVDQFGELFGFMYLTVPAKLLRPGRPMGLVITGENGNSPDWVMVFQDGLKAYTRAKADQVLIRSKGALSQLIRVEISHIAPAAEARLSAGSGFELKTRLVTGYNAVSLDVPAMSTEREVTITAAVEGRPPWQETLLLKPVAPREIWLLPHSHVDIGYSDKQPDVERKQWHNFDEAVRLAEQSDGNPEGARFKWNVEQLWAVETYLRQAGAEQKQRFIEAVRKGWIGLQATLANELTGLCQPEELFHLTDYARKISRTAGKTVDSAMISDIPSQSWSIVPALAAAGVKYFSSGPNYVASLPDGGDRIGWALKAWGDRPFYWISPSGAEKILFWMAGRGYSWFHGLNLGGLALAPRWQIFDYLDELADRGYPYSMIQVRYTVGGDNGPPDPQLAGFVKSWNAEYESPKIIIATSSEMFAEFERRHADIVPSVHGDFTGYWEDGAASTARETALNRLSAERLLQAETLWALLAPDRFPADRFTEAWRQVLLFDEHTWGAADSVSDPDGENARFQWDYKKAFALEADRMSKGLFDEAKAFDAGQATGSAHRTIDVINACSWQRTGLVILAADISVAGDLVKDRAGIAVPSQRLAGGELAFLASDVPGLGAKRYAIEKGSGAAVGKAGARGNTLENGMISAEVDPESGAVKSLRWRNGRTVEFVAADRATGLNSYFYVPGRDPKKAEGVKGVRVRPGEPGPLVASLVIESAAPGARSLVREVRVVDGVGRLELTDVLDKEKVRDKESVHIAFPFEVPGGIVRVNAGWAFVRPEADQIPGACKDFFCAQPAIDISNQDYGVTWTSVDAPLAEVGAMTDETLTAGGRRVWRQTISPSPIIYSYAMNNYWHTNYKADQEGPTTFRYVIQPHAGFDAAAVERLGLEAVRPLIAVPAGESRPVPELPFGLKSRQFIVTSLKPTEDGKGWMVRVWNAGGQPAELGVVGDVAQHGGIYLSNINEEKVRWLGMPIDVPGFGIVTLRLER